MATIKEQTTKILQRIEAGRINTTGDFTLDEPYEVEEEFDDFDKRLDDKEERLKLVRNVIEIFR